MIQGDNSLVVTHGLQLQGTTSCDEAGAYFTNLEFDKNQIYSLFPPDVLAEARSVERENLIQTAHCALMIVIN